MLRASSRSPSLRIWVRVPLIRKRVSGRWITLSGDVSLFPVPSAGLREERGLDRIDKGLCHWAVTNVYCYRAIRSGRFLMTYLDWGREVAIWWVKDVGFAYGFLEVWKWRFIPLVMSISISSEEFPSILVWFLWMILPTEIWVIRNLIDPFCCYTLRNTKGNSGIRFICPRSIWNS